MPLVADQPPRPPDASLLSRSEGSARRDGGSEDGAATESHRPLRIALVNNMPDAARDETEAHLVGLLRAAAADRWVLDVAVHRLSAADLDVLEASPPDALIVTGSEPSMPSLSDEAYWHELTRLFDWARQASASALLSCLAAHAYLLHADGIERHLLAVKCHGVFDNEVIGGHPLSAGIASPAPCPHSRQNEVAVKALVDAGWELPLRSGEAWTIATREERGCLIVLAQGHPEYGPTTLLREYRRDLRRFVNGENDVPPPVPANYLDEPATALLVAHAAGAGRGSADDFPFEQVASGIRDSWRRPATNLFANWLGSVAARVAAAGRS